MKHIRFVGTNIPVCENPDGLGKDFVVLDYGHTYEDNVSCGVCSQLLMAHNKREYERDRMVTIVQNPYQPLEDEVDIREWVWGMIFCSAFWIVLLIILWSVWCD